jgi:hypothetical protein
VRRQERNQNKSGAVIATNTQLIYMIERSPYKHK